jgi:glycosyltransferase involved in cell wall biosynthesis
MNDRGVLVVYKEDYPWDVRVEKIILALVEFQKKVFVLSNNLRNNDIVSISESCKIFRIPKMAWLSKKVSYYFKLPFWFNPIWLYALWRILEKEDIGTIIVRDLPLVRAVLLFKRKYRLTVIYDMAEVYPEMYKSMKLYSKRSIKDKILKSPLMSTIYEKSVLGKLDYTFTMIEESRDRLLRLGVAPHKIGIVSNTPSKSKVPFDIGEHTGRNLRIVYVGCITKLRGLDLLLEAVAKFSAMKGSTDGVTLDIIGTGPEKSELVDLCKRLGLNTIVKIHGWLDQADVDRKMSSANIGVVTYRVCGHWNHTIPNKIFDYMASGLPVLATPVIPIKRILTEAECGVVTRESSSDSICQGLIELCDPSVRNRLSRNGRNAILQRFNWENDMCVMKESLSKLGVL